MRILTNADVQSLWTWSAMIDEQQRAFSARHAIVPARIVMQSASGTSLYMPFANDAVFGAKIVAVRPNATPSLPATILLSDESTGAPLCLLNAAFITAGRTACGSAYATRLLCAKQVHTLLIFGAGAQAHAHFHALLSVRPSITRVVIINRTHDNARALAKRLQEEGHREAAALDIVAVDAADAEREVRAARLIVCATNSSAPLFDGAWVAPGTHVVAIGSYKKSMREFDQTLVAGARIVVDERATALAEAGELSASTAIAADLSADDEAAVRAVRGDDVDAITLFKSVGSARQDLFAATALFRAAEETGVGQVIDGF